MSDFYTTNTVALGGKPKATIADYVEQNGILVPRRFATLDEALQSDVPIIVRSEHPQEYDGASGLLFSPLLDRPPAMHDEKSLKSTVLGANSYYKSYCALMGIDEKSFLDNVSVSFWERLVGYNLSIVADSAIKGRYHIFSQTSDKRSSYLIVDNYKIIGQEMQKDLPELVKGLPSIIEFYEKVRQLDNFDPNHCPIIEAQYLDGQVYFLQYHRTRDFEPATFTLERILKTHEREATFVRGATPPTGLIVKTTAYYAATFKTVSWALTDEGGSFDYHDNSVFAELMTRRRIFQMVLANHLLDVSLNLASGHLSLSQMFKPKLSLGIDHKDFHYLVPQDELALMKLTARENGKDQFIWLYVISDGRRAYISRIKTNTPPNS